MNQVKSNFSSFFAIFGQNQVKCHFTENFKFFLNFYQKSKKITKKLLKTLNFDDFGNYFICFCRRFNTYRKVHEVFFHCSSMWNTRNVNIDNFNETITVSTLALSWSFDHSTFWKMPWPRVQILKLSLLSRKQTQIAHAATNAVAETSISFFLKRI